MSIKRIVIVAEFTQVVNTVISLIKSDKNCVPISILKHIIVDMQVFFVIPFLIAKITNGAIIKTK